jgi:hypothetical protein
MVTYAAMLAERAGVNISEADLADAGLLASDSADSQ